MTVVLAVLALVGPPPDEAAAREARALDRAYRTTQRRVQKHHKAEVRWRAKRRNVVRPFRYWLAGVRQCETRGLRYPYRAATGNGFYGAYQFVPSTWWSVGGKGMPHTASKLEQDYRAVILRRRSGTSPWPVCG